MLLLLFFAACAAYVALDAQLLRGLGRLKTGRPPNPDLPLPDVSVLIAARNEEHNLPRVLNALLAQDYAGKLRVIVVNDRSTDGTPDVLGDYSARHPERIAHLHVSETVPGMAPKKNALRLGLAAAAGEWIAVTDADCVMGPSWLSTLSREFGADTGIVLGQTALEEPAEGFRRAEGTRALEFVSYGVTSAALVGLGFPVIGNANNLAYRRRAFDEAGAFARHGAVVSGDDDFTLQEIHATGRWKVRYCSAPEALMRTAAPTGWGTFWEQRKRWASKTTLYRPGQAAFLAFVFAFYAAVFALLLAGFWNPLWGALGLLGFAVKTASDYAVMRKGLRIFGLSPLLRFFAPTALLHIPLILAAVAAGTFGGFTWKGQKLTRRV